MAEASTGTSEMITNIAEVAKGADEVGAAPVYVALALTQISIKQAQIEIRAVSF